jgi:hypothetical protein
MNLLAFRFRRRSGATLAVVCLALLFCAPAQAARSARRIVKHRPAPVGPAKSVAPPAVMARTIPLGPAGMLVAIDPETGALVPPTAEQMRILTAAERTGLLRTSVGLPEIQGPNGAIGVDLQGRFMEFTVVRLDLQGRLHFLGVNEAPAMLRLLDPRTPTPTPACEER